MSVRAIAALASLGICGLLAPSAVAQLPPLPPAPLPTVELPPAPLPQLPPAPLPQIPPAPLPPPPQLPPAPLPTVPLPPAPLPPPPSLPSLPPPPNLVPQPPSLPQAPSLSPPSLPGLPGSDPSPGGGSGPSVGSDPSSPSGGSRASGPGSRPPKGAIASPKNPGLHAWAPRDRGRPGVTLTFWLSRPALIRLLVRQEAPVCRIWGTVTKVGRRGLNQVRFLGRIGGKVLPPGIYGIRAEAVRGEKQRSLGSVSLAIGKSRKIRTTRAPASACETSIAEVTEQEMAAANRLLREGTASGEDESGEVAAVTADRRRDVASHAEPRRPGTGTATPVVGSIANAFRDTPAWLQPVMVAMLVAGLLLLQLGALPARVMPSAGAALFVARRRPTILGVGAGLLGAVGVALLTV